MEAVEMEDATGGCNTQADENDTSKQAFCPGVFCLLVARAGRMALFQVSRAITLLRTGRRKGLKKSEWFARITFRFSKRECGYSKDGGKGAFHPFVNRRGMGFDERILENNRSTALDCPGRAAYAEAFECAICTS